MSGPTYVVKGTAVDATSGETASGLRVEVWDADFLVDDFVGSAVTDGDGRFEVAFDERHFRDLFIDQRPDLYFMVFLGDDLLLTTEGSVLWNVEESPLEATLEVELPPTEKIVRDIYIRIERVEDYNPVEPTPTVPSGVTYRRDCMHNEGHPDGVIPDAEVDARAVPAVVYRQYHDSDYLVPVVDKLVLADINEPAYHHRVPGTVIYAHPGEILRIHAHNADREPHSMHFHGLLYGIDSDGSWPFGVEAADGRRSDEICPGHTWTYTLCATEDTIGVWPFHDHALHASTSIDRGLFGGIVVLPKDKPKPCHRSFQPVEDLLSQLRQLKVPVARLDDEQRRRIRQQIAWINERLQTELVHPVSHRERVLHVPLFFHVMLNPDQRPLWDTGGIDERGGTATLTFDDPGAFEYFCQFHSSMTGVVRVEAGGPASATVFIEDSPDMGFYPSSVTIQPGGTVQWINNSEFHHTATSKQGAAISTHCFNGRGFIGNSPTIVGHAGQTIRWYVFNLDVGLNWHNFHPHSQRWRLGDETIDVRSLGPAESFMVETTVPGPLLLTEEMEQLQRRKRRPKGTSCYHLAGDFLFHCHVHHHLMNGMAGLVRAKQEVWLTPEMVEEIEATSTMPIDHHNNDCPHVDHERCAKLRSGRLEEVEAHPEVIMMHAAVLPNSGNVLLWGKDRPDQSRVFDPGTGLFAQPNPQPAALPGETASTSNLWSAEHAFIDDAAGTLLVHGGLTQDAAGQPTKAYLFDPAAESWSQTAPTVGPRFYSTTITLADGTLLTIAGSGGGWGVTNTIEVYDPAAGTWSPPKTLPGTFNYLFYPWMYLLPDGELFIAGPQVPARKFDWTATPIVDDATKQYDTGKGDRGENMQGTSVLLPLRPPDYAPHVLIIGGSTAAASRSVQSIDLSDAAPGWTDEADLQHDRVSCTSVLLPDGRVLVGGGILMIPTGGPLETFDPESPADGWTLGPELAYPRLYHSSMILLPDGSVLIGGDDDGADPCERYYPEYYDQPRPAISNAPPAVGYASALTIDTPDAAAIAQVVLMRPGAVTHGFDMSQRAIELQITGDTATSVTVQTPPDANVAPPGHYLLFVVDGNRVPSEGRWIRLTP